MAVAFRRHTLLPLDDCLYALQPTIPHLTRSSLHRCLQRHGIAVAAVRGRQSSPQAQVQDLSDRLLPRRHRRSADRARQALSLRRDRPRLQVRGRSARRQGQYADRARLLGGPCRRRALQDRDRAHRQRHPIRRPAKEPIRPNRQAPRPSFRSRLSGTRDRTSTDQAQSSLDQWTGRADDGHRTRPSSDITTNLTINSFAISPTSSPPTTSPGD